MTARLTRLSLAALHMAASRGAEEPPVVARWLYRFGASPRGPDIERNFGPDDDPMAVLGLTIGGKARRTLETGYEATSHRGWFSFARDPVSPPLGLKYKLYVSPRPAALAEAFPIIAAQVAEADVRSFKVGRGIEGLLRPDKIVVYFAEWSHLTEVTRSLASALQGCPAQGVPFTAEAGCDGLLSTGVDPPHGPTPASWRSWVTGKLAQSLSERRAGIDAARVQMALDDIRAAGVDTERWTLTTDDFGRPSWK